MCLCEITLSNLLECWLCENINLVLLWISRMLGTRWHNMTVFFEKYIESNKCVKVNFLQSWAKQWSCCTVIATLSCNRWTAIWFASAPKMTGQTKKLYFDPWAGRFFKKSLNKNDSLKTYLQIINRWYICVINDNY